MKCFSFNCSTESDKRRQSNSTDASHRLHTESAVSHVNRERARDGYQAQQQNQMQLIENTNIYL